MRVWFVAALSGAAFLLSAVAAGSNGDGAATVTENRTWVPLKDLIPAPDRTPLALDARFLRGTRLATGYRLTGQALVKDACTDVWFSEVLPQVVPDVYDVLQYPRAGTTGRRCITRRTWVTIPALQADLVPPPRYLKVRTQKGSTLLPIVPVR